MVLTHFEKVMLPYSFFLLILLMLAAFRSSSL